MERGRHRLPSTGACCRRSAIWPIPATPLEEKFDTLRWVFSEREKDGLPFSFVSCLRVVGCSPLSPIALAVWSTRRKCATASATA